jgi:hypothetical protein
MASGMMLVDGLGIIIGIVLNKKFCLINRKNFMIWH